MRAAHRPWRHSPCCSRESGRRTGWSTRSFRRWAWGSSETRSEESRASRESGAWSSSDRGLVKPSALGVTKPRKRAAPNHGTSRFVKMFR
eukprot:1167904-Prymnesium_polylepis.1